MNLSQNAICPAVGMSFLSINRLLREAKSPIASKYLSCTSLVFWGVIPVSDAFVYRR